MNIQNFEMTIANNAAWEEFGDYVVAPYEQAPEQQAKIMKWVNSTFFDTSRALPEITKVEFRNRLTKRAFSAFGLDRQIYLSHNADVLTLPHPPVGKDNADKRVGVWVHALPEPDGHFHDVCRNRLDSLDPGERDTYYFTEDRDDTYIRSIVKKLNHALTRQSLHGYCDDSREAATFDTRKTHQVRFARNRPKMGGWHTDVDERPTWLNAGSYWSRVISCPLKGMGTEYVSGNAYQFVCPIGMTSAHLSFIAGKNKNMLGWGAMHRAVGNSSGRAVLLVETRYVEVEPNYPSTWRVESQLPAYRP